MRVYQGRVEFCLITSMSKGRWCFPKGIIDPGETPAETALKEAYEEAGLRGRILGEPLGEYRYGKWGRMLRVLVVLMEVEEADEHWQEAKYRQRQWVDGAEALEMVAQSRLGQFVEETLRRLVVLPDLAEFETQIS